MPNRNPDWTLDEAVLLHALYRRDPNASARDPGVRELSRLLVQTANFRGVTPLPTYRNPAGVAMRLRNLNAIDPAYLARGMKGLADGNQVDKVVWARFAEDPAGLAAEETRIRAQWRIGFIGWRRPGDRCPPMGPATPPSWTAQRSSTC